MPREIRSTQDTQTLKSFTENPANTGATDYKDRLLKLIPSEIITAYITLQGLISGHVSSQTLYLGIAFGCLLLLTPFYLKQISGVTKIGQITFTTIAFIVWVMASGGFKILFPTVEIFQDNFLGSLILIIYTLTIPVFYKG
jgi:hypothetical protein